MTPARGTVIAGKYRLDFMLGKGGMGAIWHAEHLDLGKAVAVKLVTDELVDDESVRIRFKREAKAAAALHSPHVCHIYDFGMQEGVAYIVMELLEGEDLRARLKRDHRLAIAECVDIAKQLCDGLTVAHEAGIIHRDLKPSNIFVSAGREREVVKIVDFGIAKETDSQLVVGEGTTTGMLIGSPRYMSPEQATGKDLDTRSDLWSVAVLLYQLLTGERPFRGDHLGHIIAEICSGKVDPASALVADLPPTVDAFFARAFAHDIDDRFASALELSDAFERAANGEYITTVDLPAAPLGATSAPPLANIAPFPKRPDPRDEASFVTAISIEEPAEPVPSELPFPTVPQGAAPHGHVPDDEATTRRISDPIPRVAVAPTSTGSVGLLLGFGALATVAIIAAASLSTGAPAAPISNATSAGPNGVATVSATSASPSAPAVSVTASTSIAAAPSASASDQQPPASRLERPVRVTAQPSPKPPPAKPKVDPLFGLPEK